MKVFHCDHCQHLAFFENTECVKCGHLLAYLPDAGEISSLELTAEKWWVSPSGKTRQQTYKLCDNYVQHNVCNWALRADDPHALCIACRVTRVLPDLSLQGHKEAWAKLEMAKRRLVYSLLALGLPVISKQDDAVRGLAYEFLADGVVSAQHVMTGHDNGLITLNIAEADDAEREQRRLSLSEPYRTLLGHFRHEIGHYYWDRLIDVTARLDGFRGLFGDERADYNQAQQQHYQNGPPADWQNSFVSAYATMHPWEDWAETWAHYLHMTDTLETAAACGLSLHPLRTDEPAADVAHAVEDPGQARFSALIDNWLPVTYVLNNLNRGMGLQDAYPFVLSESSLKKLRFVHDTISEQRGRTLTALQSGSQENIWPTRQSQSVAA